MDPQCGIQCLGLATSYTPWMVSQVTQQVSEHPCCPIWHSYSRSLWLGVSTHVAPYGTCIASIHPSGLIASSHQICLRHFCDLVTHPNVTHQHSGMGKIWSLGDLLGYVLLGHCYLYATKGKYSLQGYFPWVSLSMLSLGYSIGSMPAPASHSQPQPVITTRGNPSWIH